MTPPTPTTKAILEKVKRMECDCKQDDKICLRYEITSLIEEQAERIGELEHSLKFCKSYAEMILDHEEDNTNAQSIVRTVDASLSLP